MIAPFVAFRTIWPIQITSIYW